MRNMINSRKEGHRHDSDSKFLTVFGQKHFSNGSWTSALTTFFRARDIHFIG